MYGRNSEVKIPTLRRTNSREIECIDTCIVGVDTNKFIVHMGEYNDTLTVICEVVNSEDYERLNGYDCKYLKPYGEFKRFGFEIGINTFNGSLYSQLLTAVFRRGDMPRTEFEPDELLDKHVQVVVGVDNGTHLLGFRPYRDVAKSRWQHHRPHRLKD